MSDYTLRSPAGARRLNDRVTLAYVEVVRDRFGHASEGEPVHVLDVYADVRQMSNDKTLRTFQQADVVGVEVTFRTPATRYRWNCLLWRGHRVHTLAPEDVDNRGRHVRVTGWYVTDDPVQAVPAETTQP